MDINMKDVELFKKDGWVYIKTSEDPATHEKIGEKLLYDDGKYTDNELRVLEQQIRGQNTYNAWDAEDDVAGTADLMMTAADALGLAISSPEEA